MTNSDQQSEALEFFTARADDWENVAKGSRHKVNVTAQRNATVLEVLDTLSSDVRLLDIGCGSGELVITAAERGIAAHGIDFSPSMIQICQENKEAAGAGLASFDNVSVFDFDPTQLRYDVISALGVIEYMTTEQLDEILAQCARLLTAGGKLVLASRNRLFNIFSANEFTAMEIELGCSGHLLNEITQVVSADSLDAYLVEDAADASQFAQPDKLPASWVGVAKRIQYTPRELAHRLRNFGFSVTCLKGIHFHMMPPKKTQTMMDLHIKMSEQMYVSSSQALVLIPQCTSFVFVAEYLGE